MPRGERPLDIGDTPLLRFAADLRRLRHNAGRPPYRELAVRTHFSAATLSEAAGGRKLPTLAVTRAFVRACDGDAVEWEERWRTVSAELLGVRPAGAPDGELPPYLGLAAFQPEDSDRFFGRENLVGELLAVLSRQRFVAMFGPSGAGKSSILRAGLTARVRTAGESLVVLFTPGARPVEECAVQLSAAVGGQPGAVLAELQADECGLHRLIRKALDGHRPEAEVLLVVDQFEEVFTLCQSEADRTRFFAALLAAAQAENSRCRVLLGVRADFYAHCTTYPALVEALRGSQLTVGAMSADELRHAIVRPAVRAGYVVESALLATLVAEANGQVGALPLLSHSLLETWRRRQGNTLTLAGYQAVGGMEGALAQTAESLYTGLEPAQQRLAKDLFRRLTALGEGTEDTKRRIRADELDRTPDSELVRSRLTTARLLAIDRDTIEISHEALLRSWPRLRRWLAEDRHGQRLHRQLTEATAAWESLHRDPGALYRGTRLALAREWAGQPQSAPSTREREFLATSIAAEAGEHAATRRRARHLRQLVVLLTVMMLLAAGAASAAVLALRTRP